MFRYISLFFFILFIWGQDSPNPQRFTKNSHGDNVSIELFQLWDEKNSIPNNPVVFVGSSSIRKWSTAEYFPDIPIVNRGFGGSHISDVNFFIYETVLKYNPRVIIFYAGDNDINYGKSPKIILEDYMIFVDRVHSQLPNTQIIFIPIKPSLKRWALWNEMKEANMLVRNYSKESPLLHYIDTASPMLNSNFLPKRSLFVSDSLHLSKDGYDLWSRILEPLLITILEKGSQ
mgnify:CR=1 FL=1